ncbi:DUF397 domain-containing protein [Nocardia sp. NPDC051570]|uniref:DUF397 domain-containing protein n=1 Tax=Nocardia sp. NPDC051570 TaxID=3364324 RepID=UPI0037B52ED3
MSTTPRPMRTGWFKSSFSNQGTNCVEVRFDGDVVLVRDSKYLRNPANDPTIEPVIRMRAADWAAFLEAALGRSVLDVPGLPAIDHHPDGNISLRAPDKSLTYTPDEWLAFVRGIQADEFAAVA